MNAKPTEYFSILIGVVFYFLAIEMLNKIVNIPLSEISLDYTTPLVYGLLSTLFLAIAIVAGLYIRHYLLKYVYSAFLLPIALISSSSLLLKIVFTITPIFLLKKDPDKTIQLIKMVPIVAVLIYSLFIYFQGTDAIRNYVNSIVIEPSLKYADTVLEQIISTNYYSIAHQQKEAFLKGYDTALQVIYVYTAKNNQEEAVNLLKMLNEYRENISKTFDMKIEKNRELYINQSKSKVVLSIKNIFDRYIMYVFVATVLLIYSIINMYLTVVLIVVRMLTSLLKIKIKEY